MTGFQLDTSGAVALAEPARVGVVGLANVIWSDLSPFVQGYVEALFRDIQWPDPAEGYGPSGPPRFDWLASETLALILKDCERFEALYGEWPLVEHGRGFWSGRQRDKHSPEFPPLTPTLSDDGKVYLRQAQEAQS